MLRWSRLEILCRCEHFVARFLFFIFYFFAKLQSKQRLSTPNVHCFCILLAASLGFSTYHRVLVILLLNDSVQTRNLRGLQGVQPGAEKPTRAGVIFDVHVLLENFCCQQSPQPNIFRNGVEVTLVALMLDPTRPGFDSPLRNSFFAFFAFS